MRIIFLESGKPDRLDQIFGAGAARGFNCPSCGAAVALRGLAWTQTVACESCGAVIDARDPNLRILQEAQARMTVRPLIPLGTRGEWRGAPSSNQVLRALWQLVMRG